MTYRIQRWEWSNRGLEADGEGRWRGHRHKGGMDRRSDGGMIIDRRWEDTPSTPTHPITTEGGAGGLGD